MHHEQELMVLRESLEVAQSELAELRKAKDFAEVEVGARGV